MKNLFNRTEEEGNEVKQKIHNRCIKFGYTPFTYYINNAISCIDSSEWLWNIVCNLVYRMESRSRWKRKYDLDVVWYIVNECFYSEKYDSVKRTEESVINDIIETIVPDKIQQEFKDHIKSRYLTK